MLKKPKVVMIGPFPPYVLQGGISAVVSSYLSTDLNKIFNIKYISTSSEKNIFVKIDSLLISIFKLLYNLTFKKIDIIHIHSASWRSFYRKIIYVFISKLYRKKTIFHIHGGEFNLFYNRSLLNKYLITTILNTVDMIIVLSNRWNIDIKEKTKNKNIKTLFNPINTLKFSSQSNNIRKSKATNNVIYLSKLSSKKGVFDLLRTIPSVIKKISSAKFIICGNGMIDECRRICEEKNISHSVEICGWVSGQEKIKLICNSDVFVLPSYYECLPVAIIEAMAAGLPIISTCVGGIPDIVEDGINGFLIQPGDIQALSDRIIKLLEDRQLRNKMCELNEKKAKDKFDVNVVVKRLCSLYRELLPINKYIK